MLCTRYTLVKRNPKIITAEPLRCRSWQCPHCNPIRRQKCIREAAHGEPTTFITLTANPAFESSPDRRACALAAAWREVRRRACKKYGYDNIPFYCVFEKTKKGEPHLHILARVKWIDQKWLSAQMAELTQSPIVDVRAIDKGRAPARYIAKYIGKDLTPFKGTKRYWRSLDWLDTDTRRSWLEDFPPCDVEVWKMALYEAALALNRSYGPTAYNDPEGIVTCFRVRDG